MRKAIVALGVLLLLSGCEGDDSDVVIGSTAVDAISEAFGGSSSPDAQKIMLPSGKDGYYLSCDPSDDEVHCYKLAQSACPTGYYIQGHRADGWTIECH